jgi:hypothetical protein
VEQREVVRTWKLGKDLNEKTHKWELREVASMGKLGKD